MPEGNDGVGRIGFSLAVDVTNVVQENNVSGSAESNNAASVEVTSQLSPFTDLVVTDIAAAPASGWKPGDKVAVTWTTTNQGTLATPGGFSERLVVETPRETRKSCSHDSSTG